MNILLTITRSTGHVMLDNYLSKKTFEHHVITCPEELQQLIINTLGEKFDDIDHAYQTIKSGRFFSLKNEFNNQDVFICFEVHDRKAVLHNSMVNSYRAAGIAELPGNLTHLNSGDPVPGYPELTVVSVGRCVDLSSGLEDDGPYLNTTLHVK